MLVTSTRICRACGREVGTADSCVPEKWSGLSAVPYGTEQDLRALAEKHGVRIPDRCRDCGVTIGGLHHFPCAVEECPRCHGQAFNCVCLSGRLPAAVEAFGPFVDDYSLSDLTRLTGARRGQVENWVVAGWMAPKAGPTGTGHHRSFGFRDLLDAAIGVRLARFHVPMPALFRDLNVTTFRDLLPDYTAWLARSDAELEAEYVAGMQPETPASVVGEWNAHRQPGEKRLTEHAYLREKVRGWRAYVETSHRAWTLFRNPATRPTAAYLSIAIYIDEGKHSVGHFAKPDETVRAGDAAIVINLVKILEQLERATGDYWREPVKTGG